MIVRLYGVYDRKACDFLGPLFPEAADGVAVRRVQEAMDPASLLAKYPGDFQVVAVGELDKGAGREPIVSAYQRFEVVSEVSALVTPPSGDQSVVGIDRR